MAYFIRDKDGNEVVLRPRQTIVSLDGTRKASAKTLMSSSWTAEDRAKYGVFWRDPPPVVDNPGKSEPRTPEEKVKLLLGRYNLTLDEFKKVLGQ